MRSRIRLQGANCRFVRNDEYYEIVVNLAHAAKRWFLASMFIVDTSTLGRSEPQVAKLLRVLSDRSDRGLLVRVILGGSKTSPGIIEAVLSAAGMMEAFKIPHRVACLTGKTSHKKLVVADDYILLGSHNWSSGSWTGQVQDSVLIHESGMAALFGEIIREDWNELETVIR